MLNQYETDIANVESVQSFVNMKQFDDYDKLGTILTRKKLEHSYRLLSSMSATGKLFIETLDEEFLERTGTANGYSISARLLVNHIYGHHRHHLNIIKERYL